MGHITFLKQKRTQRIMELSWVDTRSQPADSLTKGSVEINLYGIQSLNSVIASLLAASLAWAQVQNSEDDTWAA
eukprot:2770045-Amphidinium_carterae.1